MNLIHFFRSSTFVCNFLSKII